jgi:hypothetical protein
MAQKDIWPKLAGMPGPAKALLTAIIFTMAIAMVGALGQIIVHDIIPTFLGEGEHEEYAETSAKHSEQMSVERKALLPVRAICLDPEMDAYPSLWHEYDFHFHGDRYPISEPEFKSTCLAHRFAVRRRFNGHRYHVAQGIYLTLVFLVTHSRRGSLCNRLRLCLLSGPL